MGPVCQGVCPYHPPSPLVPGDSPDNLASFRMDSFLVSFEHSLAAGVWTVCKYPKALDMGQPPLRDQGGPLALGGEMVDPILAAPRQSCRRSKTAPARWVSQLGSEKRRAIAQDLRTNSI